MGVKILLKFMPQGSSMAQRWGISLSRSPEFRDGPRKFSALCTTR